MQVNKFSTSNYPIKVGSTYVEDSDRKRYYVYPEQMKPNDFYYADFRQTICIIKNDAGALEIFELDANALEKLLKEGDTE